MGGEIVEQGALTRAVRQLMDNVIPQPTCALDQTFGSCIWRDVRHVDADYSCQAGSVVAAVVRGMVSRRAVVSDRVRSGHGGPLLVEQTSVQKPWWEHVA